MAIESVWRPEPLFSADEEKSRKEKAVNYLEPIYPELCAFVKRVVIPRSTRGLGFKNNGIIVEQSGIFMDTDLCVAIPFKLDKPEFADFEIISGLVDEMIDNRNALNLDIEKYTSTILFRDQLERYCSEGFLRIIKEHKTPGRCFTTVHVSQKELVSNQINIDIELKIEFMEQ